MRRPPLDVVVAGGGPAGAVTALTLARAGRRVLLVHDGPGSGAPADGVPPAGAGESLPPAANPLLRDLGLDAGVRDGGHLPCLGNVAVWGDPAPYHHDFVFDPHGHGWHLDRLRFDRDLRAAAREAGVDVLEDHRVVEVSPGDGASGPGHGRVGPGRPQGGGPALRPRPPEASGRAPPPADPADPPALREVALRHPGGRLTRVRARWLVDATGRSSSVARRLGARRRRLDRLVAWVAHLPDGTPGHRDEATPPARDAHLPDGAPGRPEASTPPARDARTWIQACADGWWHTAPLPDGTRAVTFFTDADLADPPLLATGDGFARRLREASWIAGLAGADDQWPTAPPRATGAGSARLEPCHGPGWLAVGDAASAFDPLSSQGLFHALYSGLHGGRAIHAALEGDPDAGWRWEDRVREVWTAYQRHLGSFYGAEGRWREQPFWRRRGGAPGDRDP